MAKYIRDIEWLLDAPIVNLTESAVEKSIKANADFQYDAGLKPRVIRRSSGYCCEWCAALEGEYEYPDVPDEVWMRHRNCTCIVEYYPGDGRKQNVHTKQWTNTGREERISFAQTGIQSGAKRTAGWQDRHAELYYEEIRKRRPYDDAKKIVKNIDGFTEEDIEGIRQHIFIKAQPRNGGLYRFDSDYKIAQAWQRLVDGKEIRKSDIVLLQHEKAERTIMIETGCQYEEAHEIANKKYNWREATKKEKYK